MENDPEKFSEGIGIMTSKEQVLEIYPDATIHKFPRIASDAKPDEMCHTLVIWVGQERGYGLPYEKTIGIGRNEDELWGDAWFRIQEQMIQKLEEPPKTFEDQFSEFYSKILREAIDKEIIDAIYIAAKGNDNGGDNRDR